MSQHDFTISNQTFPAFRSDLNNALQALVSVSAGASAPTTTFAYQLWYDSTNDILKMRNAADDAWITLFSFDQGTNSVQVSGEEVVDDTSPQLGGDLDVNGNKIISASNGNIELEPNGTGDIILDGDVLVGTTSQVGRLTVRGNDSAAHFRGSDTESLDITCNDGGTVELNSNNGDLALAVNTTERMRIDNSGKVGIGTTSPSTYDSRVNDLVVGSSGDAGITIFCDSGSSSRINFAVSGQTGLSNGLIGYNVNSDVMVFEVGGTERMRINGSGGISKDGSFSTSNTYDDFYFNTGSASRFRFHSGTTASRNLLGFSNPNGQVGAIETNGSSTSYLTSSDYRLKENAVDMTGAITRVKNLQPKRFNFIVDTTDTLVDGFMAHEAATVVPEAVTGTHNEVETWTQDEIDAGDAPANTSAGDNKLDGDGNTIPVYQGIDQAKLVPLLTGALQEAIAKIEALETRVQALEDA